MAGRRVEFVVAGAGVLGLSAARALARRGREVVVCERDTVGHRRSGSQGSARIFRLGYDDPGYVRLAMKAQRQWRELEAESEASLLTTTGQVTFGDDLDVLVEAMDDAGAPCQRMTGDEVSRRFPGLSVSTGAVFEPESGVLAADHCLAALRGAAGVEVREGTAVRRCVDDGRGVVVVLETPEMTEQWRASCVIVCAGPWTAPVSGLAVGLHPMATLEQTAYLAAVDGPVGDVPVFVERRRPWFYGLPDRSTGLMKISLHGAGPPVSLDDLESGDDLDSPDSSLLAELVAAARRVLPGFLPEPVVSERCVYDNTPDGDFVLDRIGNVVVGSGTSGHGFKFAPLLGEMLADLATGSPPHGDGGPVADLGRFAAGRLRSSGHRGGPTRHP
jgi:sarcosine oxidase